MIKKTFVFILITLWFAPAKAQTFEYYMGDEAILFAQTKQVNQFFRRFNGEENAAGNRYQVNDPSYRSPQIRNRYLQMIFDLDNQFIDPVQRQQFVAEVVDGEIPVLLDFHNGDWFAEVTTQFLYYGREHRLTLFLRLEEENLGYKWVITNVFFQPFREIFADEDDGKMRFLHPMSHELDFMNLIKVFKETQKVAQYTARGYKPDYLSVFLYELKRGNLSFQTIHRVRFHFFQVPGWYFELSEVRRSGPNSGWLITGLVDISEIEKNVLLKYLYYE
jgi:hypothetical protein